MSNKQLLRKAPLITSGQAEQCELLRADGEFVLHKVVE